MAWLNIIAILILFFLGRPALKALKDYEEQRNALRDAALAGPSS